ncbi:MAG: hypothetical protein ACKO5Q_19590 [Microcystaceae cyanobacterium]
MSQDSATWGIPSISPDDSPAPISAHPAEVIHNFYIVPSILQRDR